MRLKEVIPDFSDPLLVVFSPENKAWVALALDEATVAGVEGFVAAHGDTPSAAVEQLLLAKIAWIEG